MKKIFFLLALLLPISSAAQVIVEPAPINLGGNVVGELRLLEGARIANAKSIGWCSDASAATCDTFLLRGGTNTLGLLNGTTASRFDIYNTFTSSSNNEVASIDWRTSSNLLLIGSRTAATGTGRVAGFIAQSNNGGGFAGIRANRTALPLVTIGTFSTSSLSSGDTVGSAGTFVEIGQATSSVTSGTVNAVAIIPTYNQASGTAANTDLLVNRTQTAIGSGAQNLLDLQVGGTSQFKISNNGTPSVNGTAGVSATCASGVDSITITKGIITAVTCTP